MEDLKALRHESVRPSISDGEPENALKIKCALYYRKHTERS